MIFGGRHRPMSAITTPALNPFPPDLTISRLTHYIKEICTTALTGIAMRDINRGMTGSSKQKTIRMSVVTVQRIEELAKKERRNFSDMARIILEDAVDYAESEEVSDEDVQKRD